MDERLEMLVFGGSPGDDTEVSFIPPNKLWREDDGTWRLAIQMGGFEAQTKVWDAGIRKLRDWLNENVKD